MPIEVEPISKSAISVGEMASMLSFSRARFYQLVTEGIFLPPVFDIQTHRPFYPADFQQRNLQARRSNTGINGKIILFYAPRSKAPPSARKSSPKKDLGVNVERLRGLRLSMKQLGLEVPAEKVAAAVKRLHPRGIEGIEDGPLVREVFRFLRENTRRNSADNVGR